MSRENVLQRSTAARSSTTSANQAIDIAEDEDQAQSEIFCAYQCGALKFGREHPGDIAEPAGLALIPLPEPTYPIQESLPTDIVDAGKLSKLQLEGVLYACQRHLCFLPNGDRCGFFIGDGAGVGKGRQIAGIILDNWARGRFQHVWFSMSRDLREDAQRDLSDLGVHLKVVDGCQELDAESKAFGLSSEFKEGVLFTTYSTLIGVARNGKVSRLDQIVAWCGGKDTEWRKIPTLDKNGAQIEKDALFAPNFSGVIIFDECHKAKNHAINKEGDDKASDKGSQTARCVIDIQYRLPKARVVYCSATGVTELSNLAYCERLGLWGAGLPFSSFEQFHQNASKRGVFFLEMLAMELKRSGAYVSRGLSFKQAEFETLHCTLNPAMVREYNAAAAFWVKIRIELQRAVALSGASNRLLSAYWGAHQRFFRQLILAFKVDFIVQRALMCLKNGHAVVIGIQTTGEAAQSRGIERRNGRTSSFLSACRETIIAFIQMNWPVKVVSDIKDGSELDAAGVTAAVASESTKKDSKDLLTKEAALPKKSAAPAGSIISECEQMRDRLLEEADSLILPITALDDLIDKLGGSAKVAEMTGRRGRLVRNAAGTISFQQRGAQEDDVDQVNVIESNRFMKGTKLIAIISDAASTGISLHASNQCLNQRRRVHFTMELPWSADKAVQQLGRTHRSNQATGPIYSLVVTDLGGERRFAAAVAKRLQSLGALTKGDRRAAAGQDLHEFDLDNQYGRDSLRKMLEAIDGGTSIAAGAIPQDLKKRCGDVCMGDGDDVRTWDGIGDTSSDKARWILAINGHFQKALDMIGMGPNRKESDSSNVSKFLGRLLGLAVQAQNALFHYFFSVLEYRISSAVKEGRYTDSITDLFGAESLIESIKKEDIYKDHVTGATSVVHTLRVDRGLSWESALAKLQSYNSHLEVRKDSAAGDIAMEARSDCLSLQGEPENKLVSDICCKVNIPNISSISERTEAPISESSDGTQTQHIPLSGFYETKHVVPGRGFTGWLLALRKIDRPGLYIVARPNTGMMRVEMEVDELRGKYVARSPVDAEAGWRRLHEASLSFDIGCRVLTVHLLCGSLVPLWEQIECVVNSYSNSSECAISKRDLEMKVVRVKVDGQYNIGLKLPGPLIQCLQKRFQVYALLQQGRALQVSPPQFNTLSATQLAPGQGIVVLVNVVGRDAQQKKGLVLPSATDSSSYTLQFPWTVGSEKCTVRVQMKYGSSAIQIAMLNDAVSIASVGTKNASRKRITEKIEFQMRVEEADPVQPKALSKALTAPPTMRSFFTVLPKAAGPGSPITSAWGEKGEGRSDSYDTERKAKVCTGGIKRKFESDKLVPVIKDAVSEVKTDLVEASDIVSVANKRTPETCKKRSAFAGIPSATTSSYGLETKRIESRQNASGGPTSLNIFEAAKRSASTAKRAAGPGCIKLGTAAVEVMDLTRDDD